MEEKTFGGDGLSVAQALKAWAAAAGAGGGYFPAALAALLDPLERVELENVWPLLRKAAAEAWERHCEGGSSGPGPRGPVLEMEGPVGLRLEWESEHCRVAVSLQLEDDLRGRSSWIAVTQHTPPVGEKYTCGYERRRAAAEAALAE